MSKALRSLGASPLQAFQFGLWPNARPIIWSQPFMDAGIQSAPPAHYWLRGIYNAFNFKLYAESA